jgi:hypothetical protein
MRTLTGTPKQIAYASKIIKEMEGEILSPYADFAKYESVQAKFETEKFDEYAKSREEDYTKEELMFLNHQAKKTEAYFIYNYVTDAGTIIEYHTNYCYNGKKHYYDGYGMHEYIKK